MQLGDEQLVESYLASPHLTLPASESVEITIDWQYDNLASPVPPTAIKFLQSVVVQ